MKKDIVHIQASVKGRLQNKARESSRPFAEVLQYYGIERFLYRYSRSPYAGKFILKGALMCIVWNIPQRRTTLDIDFLAHYSNEVAQIESAVKYICTMATEPDGLVFDEKTVAGRRIKEDAEYGGVRIKFTGFLERSRIPMQIDVGFGDIVYPGTMLIDYPVILDFPKPNLACYPVESVISEKFEAMVTLGSLNSRMKDFYDIWLLMHTLDINGSSLAGALKRTFGHRKITLPSGDLLFVPEIYDEKSDRQMLWKAFLNKGAITHVPEKLSMVAEEIETFLLPPLTALHNDYEFTGKWYAPGPWR